MPRRVIGIASKSAYLSADSIPQVASALHRQVREHLPLFWKDMDAGVIPLDDPAQVPDGVWPIFIVDSGLPFGVSGIHHLDPANPYANVIYSDDWSIDASHECLEMLLDWTGNTTIRGRGIAIDPVSCAIVDIDGDVDYLVELCDPVQSRWCSYPIDEVLVSDFFSPQFFDAAYAPGVKYSHSDKLQGPRRVAEGGYLTWIVGGRHVGQLRISGGIPQIFEGDLPEGSDPAGVYTASRCLRGRVDAMTRTAASIGWTNRAERLLNENRYGKHCDMVVSHFRAAAALSRASRRSSTQLASQIVRKSRKKKGRDR